MPPSVDLPPIRPLTLCSNRGGYEAVPERSTHLDLTGVRTLLESAGIPLVDARVMLIASLEAETTISASGRLLFKTRDGAVAARALAQLRRLLGADPVAPPSVRSG